MAHFVHAAAAEDHPLLRIGIDRVVGRIIENRRELQHRTGRQQRLDVVLVDVGDLPVMIVLVDLADHFPIAVRIDRFHGHDLAAHVQMRPETVNHRRLLEHMGALQHLVAMRRNDDVLTPSPAFEAIHPEHRLALGHEFRSFAFGIEPEADFHDVIRSLGADRKIVQVPGYRAVRGNEHPRAFRIDFPGLADAVTRQRHRALLAFGNQHRVAVMHDFLAQRIRRLEFRRAQPALLFQPAEFDPRFPPLILAVGDHVIGTRAHDKVRGAKLLRKLPVRPGRKFQRRRQIRRIAFRRTGVDPGRNQLDLFVAQGSVVLELLDADVRIDMPGRHDALAGAILDQESKGLHLPVIHQRHRADAVGIVAGDAFLLQDRRDVAGIGQAVLGRRNAVQGNSCGEQQREPCNGGSVSGHGLVL